MYSESAFCAPTYVLQYSIFVNYNPPGRFSFMKILPINTILTVIQNVTASS